MQVVQEFILGGLQSIMKPPQLVRVILIVILLVTNTHCLNSIEQTIGQYYEGTYTTQPQTKPFDYLTSERGRIKAVFRGSRDPKTIDSLSLYIMDPTYEDQRVVLVEIKGAVSLDPSWNSTNHSAAYTLLWRNREEQTIYVGNVSTWIEFDRMSMASPRDLTFKMSMRGPSFAIEASFAFENHILMTTLAYCLYVTGVVAIQIYSAHQMMEEGEWDTNPHLLKMALLSLALCSIQDFAATMMHIDELINFKTGFAFFLLPSLAYLVLFALFDMKMLFLGWKSQFNAYCETQEMLRDGLTTFYAQFYIGLFLYLTLNYFFAFDAWMIALKNMLLLPQIIHNAKMGHRPGFSEAYIIGYMGARLLIPVYERALAHNYFYLAPNYGLVLLLLGMYLLQALLLWVQHRWGSRCFVPRALIPNYYEYRRRIRMDEDNKGDQCSICIQSVFAPDPKISMAQTTDEDLLEEADIMLTPCKHKFHQECLKEWMHVKLECPTCRSELPIF